MSQLVRGIRAQWIGHSHERYQRRLGPLSTQKAETERHPIVEDA